jgi:hypothetical protein
MLSHAAVGTFETSTDFHYLHVEGRLSRYLKPFSGGLNLYLRTCNASLVTDNRTNYDVSIARGGWWANEANLRPVHVSSPLALPEGVERQSRLGNDKAGSRPRS